VQGCFDQPEMYGTYFSDADYRAIYPFAPNIQNAFDLLDKARSEARKEIGDRLSKSGNAKPS
jgi:hypothetical protein